MQLTVKTLKGGKFSVDAEPSSTVAEVKTFIEAQKSELPAANMKLIHSGKVLKDDATVESCNIKPNAFLVVMISKAKKAAAAPAPAPAVAAPVSPPAPAASTETPSTAAPVSTTTTTTPAPTSTTETTTTTDTTPPAANTTSTTTTTTATTSSTSQPTATETATSTTATPSDSFPPELVANLTAMGFPDAEVRACLRASQGNPDVAVEYLMSGIPPYAQEIANATNSAPATTTTTTSSSSSSSSSGPTSTSSEPLAALRNHPQINQLRQLVQSNPSTLQAVLTQIGQQQPDLLQEINSNQELFLQIMNEPVGTTNPGSSTSSGNTSTSSPAAPSLPTNAGAGAGSNPAAAMLEGMNNPAQMAQMIQSMTPVQLQDLAGMMGLSPEQLTATAQLISRMPQEDFQHFLNMAMQRGAGGAGGAGLADFMGGLGGAGGDEGAPPGAQVVRLTREEMEAVDRLADMGFDRTEAAQAYLACDKNEALAANLLMDGGWGDVDMAGGGADAGGSNNNGNDGDDMYE